MPADLATPDRVIDALHPRLVEDARLVLCDLDGCLVSDGVAFADSAAFIDGCGPRLWIVSNNSTHAAVAMSADLAALGLDVPADRILLAGEQTLLHLAERHKAARLALFASPALEARAQALGFDLCDARPDIVLLCRDTALSLSRLSRLAVLAGEGAEFWVANTDTAHPGQDGRPVAETGALLAAVRAILGDIAVHSIGKPHGQMARIALSAGDAGAAETVFVGDNDATDGALARDMGMRFLHLRRPEGFR